MLHILLIILKIIGILLLVILGVVLLFLLAVLLIPVRYCGEASFHGAIRGKVKIFWFLHLLSLQAVYEGSPDITVRVFGKRILSGFSGEEDNEEETMEEPGTEEEQDGEEMILSAQEVQPDSQTRESERIPEQEPEKESVFPEEKKASSKKQRRCGKKKISSIIQSIGRHFREGEEKLKKGGELYQQAEEFLAKEANRRTLRLVKRQAGRLLRHLSPRRLKGELIVGLEDPYRMGQIVSAAALLYPVIRDRIRFTPVFNEKVFDGELSLRGRIRVGTLLWLAVRLLLDRNFRKLLRKILNRGGK